MEKKCFVALLMVVVMMCACWTLQGTMEKQKSSPFPICSMGKRLLLLMTERFIGVIL